MPNSIAPDTRRVETFRPSKPSVPMNTPAPSKSAQLIAAIEAEPMRSLLWRELLSHSQAQRDFMTIQSVALIMHGLERIERLPVTPSFSLAHRSLFARLAKSCNNPSLLKEAGRFYLAELNLPDVARGHLERATKLGGKNRDTDLLLTQCQNAIKRAADEEAIAPQAGSEAGVKPPKTPQGKIATLISKTGKLGLRAVVRKEDGSVKREIAPSLAMTTQVTNDVRGKDAAEIFELADTWIAAGQVDQARLACEKASASAMSPAAPADVAGPVWTHLGIYYFNAGRLDEAVKSFAAAQALTPDRMVSWFNLGTALQVSGRYDEALRCYLAADGVEAGHPKVWCNLGTLYFEQDDHVQAEAAFRRTLEIQPDYARAWDNLGATLGADNRMEEALAACRMALKYRPEYKEPWFKIGMITYGLDLLEQAEVAFDQAGEIAACSSYTQYFLAMIYARTNRVQDAIVTCMRGNEKPGYSAEMAAMAWSEIGQAFVRTRDYAPAEQALQKAVDLAPLPEHYLHLAAAHAERGHFPQALAAYQHAAELQPEADKIWIRIAQTATILKNHQVAAAAWEKQVELDPNDAHSWDELARCLEQLEKSPAIAA